MFTTSTNTSSRLDSPVYIIKVDELLNTVNTDIDIVEWLNILSGFSQLNVCQCKILHFYQHIFMLAIRTRLHRASTFASGTVIASAHKWVSLMSMVLFT